MTNYRQLLYGDKMIKVSVIIPVFNGSEYISECIRGVQRQTLHEIEILCVDDGSLDNSLHLLQQMQKSDNRVRVFEQKNRGAGSARNYALKNATGEFVCFLDVDDSFLSDNALEELYRNAVGRKAKVCGGQMYIDSDRGLTQVSVYGNLWDGTKNWAMLAYREYQQDFYFTSYLYSRQMLQENNISFPAYRQYEDPPFCVRALSAAGWICVTNIRFYYYKAGYKERIYDRQMACDQIRGMTDNLRFSRQNGLKRLHRITFYRLVNSCRRELKELCRQKSAELMIVVDEAEHSVCWDWLEEKCRVRERSLRAFCDESGNEGSGEVWPLGYDGMKQGERVVLYGAGEVGRSYCRQIRNDGKVSLCAWVDGNARQVREIEGVEIVPPERLGSLSFDYVIIAVANMMVALEIMDTLGSAGIAPGKVVWDIRR